MDLGNCETLNPMGVGEQSPLVLFGYRFVVLSVFENDLLPDVAFASVVERLVDQGNVIMVPGVEKAADGVDDWR